MKILRVHYILCLILFVLKTNSQIVLPSLISDGMVLQMDEKITIWGWSSPNENININLENNKYSGKANSDGRWEITINPHTKGGPYSLFIHGEKETIEINNILFGDVWLCSGQSNMVHQMKLHASLYQNDINNATNGNIRQFLIPRTVDFMEKQDDYEDAQWAVCNPESIKEFSAVAYFFAQQIYEKHQVPIGIINASVGGTPVESWISENGLKEFKDISQLIEKNKDSEYIELISRKKQDQLIYKIPTSENIPFYDPGYSPKNWKKINVPGYWEDQGIKDLDGVVWFRKEIEMSSKPDENSKIYLGRIVDADEVYINGQKIDGRTHKHPQRIYDVPNGILKKGKNILVVKVTNYKDKGGFVPDKPYYLTTQTDTLDLKGTWTYRVSEVFSSPEENTSNFVKHYQPSVLFNGMIAPLKNYTIKGILWYQGEANTSNPHNYAALQKAHIEDWRSYFNQANLPYISAQLPNFKEYNYLTSESNWAELRNEQLKVLEIPNTALATTIDLGEWNDIHPDNKKEVGRRMALLARKLVYNEDIIGSSPLIKSVEKEGSSLVVSFDNAGTKLKSIDNEPIRSFEIAGGNKKYFWATAEIKGNKIKVWNESIENPQYIRYAWSDNPDVNLYNEIGLPVTPFEEEINANLGPWKGKKYAVVLTYDDALNVHLDRVIPALDSLGIKGTFYLSGFFPNARNRIYEWRKAATNGHELGNHTLYHPCDASKENRSWVSPDNDLKKYTNSQIVHEIQMNNAFLEAIDGQKERTFAFTCGDTETGDGSFVELIKNDFIAMRGVEAGLNHMNNIQFDNIYSYGVNGQTGEELVKWLELAKEHNAMIVFLFHGVGGEHSLNISLEAHQFLLNYLSENQDEIWITTLRDATKYIQENKN